MAFVSDKLWVYILRLMLFFTIVSSLRMESNLTLETGTKSNSDLSDSLYVDIMKRFHNMGTIKSWNDNTFTNEGYRVPLDSENGSQIYQKVDNNLLRDYYKRKTHRERIKETSDTRQEVFDSDRALLKRDSVVLADSIPIKDSINYGSAYAYTFETSTSTNFTPSYEQLVFISASLCKLPLNWNMSSTYNGLSLFYTFNETYAENKQYEQMSRSEFQNGYAEALAQLEVYDFDETSETTVTLYVFIIPDSCSFCNGDSSWVFELGLSQKNILFLYDTEPVVSVVDVDYESALFNATEVSLDDTKTFGMYIFNSSSNSISLGLNQSWCAVAQNQDFIQWVELNSTSINNQSNIFPVTELDNGTQYDAVLIVTYDNMPYGGGVFQAFSFATANTTACKLLYGLEFCDEVAYAVPASESFAEGLQSWEELAKLYDDYAQSYYEPFEYALQQEACDTELDARYSPIRTCDDCRYSYKQWLCAVTIPRCDYTASEANQHKFYPAGEGRNEFIEDVIQPPLEYSEIQPCLNVCYAIVRDCPSRFAFGCPVSSEFISLSYGDPSVTNDTVSDDDSKICNYLGIHNFIDTTSSVTL